MNSAKEPYLEIKVTEGPQAGASMLLNNTGCYRLGSDPTDDHDVLFRAVDKDFCLSIDTTAGDEYVQVEYGDISIGTRQMKVGERFPVKMGDRISVANISFEFVQHGLQSDDGAAENSSGNSDGLSSGLTMFVGGLLLTGGSALAIVGASKPTVKEVSVAPLQEVLSEASLHSLEIVQEDNEPVRIVGMLHDQSEQEKLLDIVSDRPEVIHLSTKTEQQLIDDVTEFYRINDVAAEVSRESDSSLLVVTRESDLNHLSEIEGRLKSDVALVENIVRENTPELVKKKKRRTNPDNQVLMVIGGETPYVMTRGGGRYFEGSVLPSGQVIARIDNNSVVLRKGEDEFLMTF